MIERFHTNQRMSQIVKSNAFLGEVERITKEIQFKLIEMSAT